MVTVGLYAAVLGNPPVKAAQEVAVTSCGQEVQAGAIGTLAADLDCTGGGDGVVLGHKATLRLNGFTMTGASGFGINGVECPTRCTVEGPGTIRNFGEAGVSASRAIKVIGSTLSENKGVGVLAALGAVVVDSVVTGNDGVGVKAGMAKVTASTVSDNGTAGLVTQRAKLVGSTVESNGRLGVVAYRTARVIDSTVTGNGTSPDCGTAFVCVDIMSARRPLIRDTLCDISFSDETGTDWNVCRLDP